MAVSKELRTRIKSVTSTKQITKAMELVSSAKMRRASQATLANRPYSEALLRVINTILSEEETEFSHPLLKQGTSQSSLLVVIAADRGQAGAFTTNISKHTVAYIAQQKVLGRTVSCITLGKKIHKDLSRRGISIIQNYPLPASLSSSEDLRALYEFCSKQFSTNRFGAVDILFTAFGSMLRQEPVIEPLFPLHIEKSLASHQEVLYEPSAVAVLETLLPYIAEVHLYQAVLESAASEHSARRIAMKSATDNATSMIDRLKLTYNRLRQGAITQEIAEITSGAAALE